MWASIRAQPGGGRGEREEPPAGSPRQWGAQGGSQVGSPGSRGAKGHGRYYSVCVSSRLLHPLSFTVSSVVWPQGALLWTPSFGENKVWYAWGGITCAFTLGNWALCRSDCSAPERRAHRAHLDPPARACRTAPHQ